jgi:hypothetical protein
MFGKVHLVVTEVLWTFITVMPIAYVAIKVVDDWFVWGVLLVATLRLILDAVKRINVVLENKTENGP